MRNHLRNLLITGGVFVALGIGCAHHSVPSGTGGGPSAAQASIDSAVDRIALERCDREQRCGNVAEGKDFENRDKCLTVMRGKTIEGLPIEKCKGGIDQQQLRECLAEIQDQKCGDPFSALTRRTACRVAELCYD